MEIVMNTSSPKQEMGVYFCGLWCRVVPEGLDALTAVVMMRC
jgi:hypothetical protein